jgi:hypothetical protein
VAGLADGRVQIKVATNTALDVRQVNIPLLIVVPEVDVVNDLQQRARGRVKEFN